MTVVLLAEPPSVPTFGDGETVHVRIAPRVVTEAVPAPPHADHHRSTTSGPTLDALVTRLWEQIRRGTDDNGAMARCPLCADGAMRPELAADGTLVQARCSACATVLR